MGLITVHIICSMIMDNVFLHDLHLVTYTTVQSHRPSVIKITFSGKGSLSYIC